MSPPNRVCPACGVKLDPPVAPTDGDGEGPDCLACGHGVRFQVESAGDVQVVRFRGRGIVTEQNVMRALERVRYLVSRRGRGRLLLDFDGVTYLSSTILARLLALHRTAADDGVRVKLCNIQPDVQDIFRLTRLEGIFAIHPSRTDALAAF